MRRLWMITIVAASAISFQEMSKAADFFVYSVYRPLDLGSPGESPQKDYFVNMGSRNGIQKGSTLEVIRRISTYDLTNQKLYKDVAFPIAKLKVIHTETDAAIARLDVMLPADSTPAISPSAVMVGDLVRKSD